MKIEYILSHTSIVASIIRVLRLDAFPTLNRQNFAHPAQSELSITITNRKRKVAKPWRS